VMVSGYKVRCALEDDDAANIRFDKLRRLIRESPRTIHDLSRTPGPQSYVAGFRKFKEDLPGIAAGLEWGAAEIDPFANYRAYLLFLAEFMRTAKRVSAD